MTFEHGVPPEASPRARALARRVVAPVEAFARAQVTSGLVLLAATTVALVAANSPWAGAYAELIDMPVRVQVGPWGVERSIHFVVNDVLMTLFFFAVGLELRTELHGGVLATPHRAALPVAAAVGGMVVPALFYLAIAWPSPDDRVGWGVPMATDIAFSLGVLALLGKGLPASIRVMLLALAIVDDIGSILVIAVVYSGSIDLGGLLLAAAGVAGVFALQRFGVRRPVFYVAPGAIVWLGVYRSGVHPAISGAIVGLVTPARSWLGPTGLLDAARGAAERVERELASGPCGAVPTARLAEEATRLDLARREALAPSIRLQLALSRWVELGVMPGFALANANVTLAGSSVQPSLVAIGIVVGLVVGKPLGILAGCAIAVRLRLARLPEEAGWRAIVVLGVVAGIGFTMALFVAKLAFVEGVQLERAKAGILAASAIAIGCTFVAARWLSPRRSGPAPQPAPAAAS